MFEPGGGYDLHVAFECKDEAELLAWKERVNAMGVRCSDPIDHGFVRSIYMYDPNGLQVEVTTKTDRYDEIVADESAKVDAVMADWTRKSRDAKEQLFGATRLDQRGEICAENIQKIVDEMMKVGRVKGVGA